MFAFDVMSSEAHERRQRYEALARRRRQVRALPDQQQPAAPSPRVRERLGKALVTAGVRVAGQRSALSQLRPP